MIPDFRHTVVYCTRVKYEICFLYSVCVTTSVDVPSMFILHRSDPSYTVYLLGFSLCAVESLEASCQMICMIHVITCGNHFFKIQSGITIHHDCFLKQSFPRWLWTVVTNQYNAAPSTLPWLLPSTTPDKFRELLPLRLLVQPNLVPCGVVLCRLYFAGLQTSLQVGCTGPPFLFVTIFAADQSNIPHAPWAAARRIWAWSPLLSATRLVRKWK